MISTQLAVVLLSFLSFTFSTAAASKLHSEYSDSKPQKVTLVTYARTDNSLRSWWNFGNLFDLPFFGFLKKKSSSASTATTRVPTLAALNKVTTKVRTTRSTTDSKVKPYVSEGEAVENDFSSEMTRVKRTSAITEITEPPSNRVTSSSRPSSTASHPTTITTTTVPTTSTMPESTSIPTTESPTTKARIITTTSPVTKRRRSNRRKNNRRRMHRHRHGHRKNTFRNLMRKLKKLKRSLLRKIKNRQKKYDSELEAFREQIHEEIHKDFQTRKDKILKQLENTITQHVKRSKEILNQTLNEISEESRDRHIVEHVFRYLDANEDRKIEMKDIVLLLQLSGNIKNRQYSFERTIPNSRKPKHQNTR